jgi:hypothetical protein
LYPICTFSKAIFTKPLIHKALQVLVTFCIGK